MAISCFLCALHCGCCLAQGQRCTMCPPQVYCLNQSITNVPPSLWVFDQYLIYIICWHKNPLKNTSWNGVYLPTNRLVNPLISDWATITSQQHYYALQALTEAAFSVGAACGMFIGGALYKVSLPVCQLLSIYGVLALFYPVHLVVYKLHI